jgi:histidine triad (HIT) family protein
VDDCIFCKLVRKQIPAHGVFEDEATFAFLDRNPINPGHVLVVSKRHEPDIFSLDERTYLDVMRTVRRVASAVRSLTSPKRVGLLVAGWDVPHAHVHVVPMNEYHDLTSKQMLEGKRASPRADDLDRVAGGIRSLIE